MIEKLKVRKDTFIKSINLITDMTEYRWHIDEENKKIIRKIF